MGIVNVITNLYMWYIRKDIEKAKRAMQSDPVLLKIKSNIKTIEDDLEEKLKNDPESCKKLNDVINNLQKEQTTK